MKGIFRRIWFEINGWHFSSGNTALKLPSVNSYSIFITACCSSFYRFLWCPFYHCFSSQQHLIVFLCFLLFFFFTQRCYHFFSFCSNSLFVECRGADNSGFEHVTDMYYSITVSVFCALLISWCSVVFLVTSEHFTICFHRAICREYKNSCLRIASSFITACAGRLAHYMYVFTLNFSCSSIAQLLIIMRSFCNSWLTHECLEHQGNVWCK